MIESNSKNNLFVSLTKEVNQICDEVNGLDGVKEHLKSIENAVSDIESSVSDTNDSLCDLSTTISRKVEELVAEYLDTLTNTNTPKDSKSFLSTNVKDALRQIAKAASVLETAMLIIKTESDFTEEEDA